jgi:hypothetical protein
MKTTPPSSSQPWTSEDEVRLRTLAAAGRSAATIAERLKRSEAGIRYKARSLNINLARVANGRTADISQREGLMANKSQGTWYVSFDVPRRKHSIARATETFPNERAAKEFARAKLIDTPNITAGTLNPHLPKRTIAATQILEWLEE